MYYFLILGIFLGSIIVPGVVMMVKETLLDGLIFMVILGVVEYGIWRFTQKSNGKLMKIQLQIVEECEARGIDIIEYVEELKKNELTN